eukprot:GHUV01052853.1.p1 GENE.GHUV01052853.1~~GHUV01052853.1.p1  ORF type:complete len:100 (+),score=19.06 GHUV01052853.1:64-363(+)
MHVMYKGQAVHSPYSSCWLGLPQCGTLLQHIHSTFMPRWQLRAGSLHYACCCRDAPPTQQIHRWHMYRSELSLADISACSTVTMELTLLHGSRQQVSDV